jgi:hypothetical protein
VYDTFSLKMNVNDTCNAQRKLNLKNVQDGNSTLQVCCTALHLETPSLLTLLFPLSLLLPGGPHTADIAAGKKVQVISGSLQLFGGRLLLSWK